MCKINPFAFDDALEPECVGEYISDKCIVLVVNKSFAFDINANMAYLMSAMGSRPVQDISQPKAKINL
jgi:hypothetical protein